jgi:hypothetical protein
VIGLQSADLRFSQLAWRFTNFAKARYYFMNPPAHRPPTPAQEEHRRLSSEEHELFFENLDLVLQHEKAILLCDEYFFCTPEFAGYGLYSNFSLNVGTLLLGWRHGIFIDTCQKMLGPRKEKYTCGGKVYVNRFGGLLSGTGWGGFCQSCKNIDFVWDGTLTWIRWEFGRSSNKQFKNYVDETEEYKTSKFSFADPALVPVIKTRPVRRWLVKALSVAELIDELKNNRARPATPKDKTRLIEFLTVNHGEKAPSEKIKLIVD